MHNDVDIPYIFHVIKSFVQQIRLFARSKLRNVNTNVFTLHSCIQPIQIPAFSTKYFKRILNIQAFLSSKIKDILIA